jgi:beta-glucanase (GH16 family)
LARARFALGVSPSRATPTLVLLAAPASSTAASRAVLRFSVSGGRAFCAHDGASLRRCSSPVAFKGLAAGAHSFRIRAANRHGTTTIETASTVVPKSSATPAPAAAPAPAPAAAPVAPSTPAPAPSSAPPGRRLVFEDNFDGSRLNTSNWTPYNGAGNGGNGLRRDSAIQLDGGGNLVITASSAGGQTVSGGMSSQKTFTYGWYEFRVRTDPDPTGTMNGAVLTWPVSGHWPVEGENDIYETGNNPGTRTPFYSYVHYSAANQQYVFRHDADAAQWHTMAMDWRPDAIRFYRDGALAATLTDAAAIAHAAHFLCIQLDAMVARQLTAPVRMFVDYVRIYQ